jgi:hypothetical protein
MPAIRDRMTQTKISTGPFGRMTLIPLALLAPSTFVKAPITIMTVTRNPKEIPMSVNTFLAVIQEPPISPLRPVPLLRTPHQV